MLPERGSLKEASIRQNVRVGDKLGIRITGEDAQLDLRPEKRISETAFFQEIYIRANDGGEIIKVNQDLTIKHLIRLAGGEEEGFWVEATRQKNKFYEYYPTGIAKPGYSRWTENPQGEIVIIPEYAYQTSELLSMLPESTITEEFAQIEASIANSQ